MKILIVAGGTGGHLYPGIAVARKLREHEVLFVVRRGDLGREILQREGFHVEEIAGQGFPRVFSLRIFSFPYRFLKGWFEAGDLLKKFRPDGVLAMGGYLSVPVILQAKRFGARTLLHEQNVFPGLANRFLSRWADSMAVSFPETAAYLKGANVWISGLPIRPEIGQVSRREALQKFGFSPDVPTYFVFGGSLGAQRLNSLALDAWRMMLTEGRSFQVIHITGHKDFDRVEKLYRLLKLTAKVLPYSHDMAYAYAAASAVLCRAGASAVAEVLAVRRPALVVPYPYASDNHQIYNAQIIEKSGWGRLILDKALTPRAIADFLINAAAVQGRDRSETLRQDSADRLADYLTSRSG